MKIIDYNEHDVATPRGRMPTYEVHSLQKKLHDVLCNKHIINIINKTFVLTLCVTFNINSLLLN